MIAFILRQIGRYDTFTLSGHDDKESTSFRPGQPREKWMRKRTSIKIKNVTANHRANDVIVKDGEPQRLIARFMYGPLDMITLTGILIIYCWHFTVMRTIILQVRKLMYTL